MERILMALLLAISLSGCAILKAEPWPERGTGGFAEWTEITDERARTQMARLTKAREQGASVYAAADLVDADMLMQRIRRELAGGLVTDAAMDMGSLDEKLSLIESRIARSSILSRRGRRS